MKGHLFLISLLPIPENLGLKKLCRHDSDILHFFREGCWERGDDYFQGAMQFSHTKKIKT